MPETIKKTLIIADEQDLIEKGIQEAFRKNYNLITKVENAQELLQILTQNPSAIAIVSTALSGFNIVKFSTTIQQHHSTSSILLASLSYSHIYTNFVHQGIYSGYFTKNIKSSELIAGINAVSNGSQFIAAAIHKCYNLAKNNIVLSYTGVKLEVFIYLTALFSVDEIATHVNLSSDSIYKKRTAIFNETGCTSEDALIIYAVKNKLCTQEAISRLVSPDVNL